MLVQAALAMQVPAARNMTVWVGLHIAELVARNMMVLAVPRIAGWAALHMTASAALVTRVLVVRAMREWVVAIVAPLYANNSFRSDSLQARRPCRAAA